MNAAEILGLARLKQLLPLLTTDEAVLQRCEILEQAAANALQNLDDAIKQRAAELAELNKANDRHYTAREKAANDRDRAFEQKAAALDMRAAQLEADRAYVARMKHELEVKLRTYAHLPLPDAMHVFDIMLPPDDYRRGKKKQPDIFG